MGLRNIPGNIIATGYNPLALTSTATPIVSYLVVAGGGGAGSVNNSSDTWAAGGGGAGGLLTGTLSVSTLSFILLY